MKISSTNWLYLGSIMIIMLGGVVGYTFYDTIQMQVAEAAWNKKKHEAINQIVTLEKLLVDMETGQRAYRSTNEKKYLLPFTLAQSHLTPTIEKLSELVSDNAKQLNRLSQIEIVILAMRNLWSTQPPNFEQYDRKVVTEFVENEKKQMDDVRRLLKQMYDNEQRLIVTRNQYVVTHINDLTKNSIWATVLLFILAFVLTYFYYLEFRNKGATEQKLQDNLRELEELNQISKDRNWYLKGLTVVNDAIQNVNEIEELAQKVLKALTSYLELPAGAFYCYHPETKQLVLSGSSALSPQAPYFCEIGEGIVGQAAKERELVSVRAIPESYWTIKSASGEKKPGEIHCIPLWFGKELKGVIELVSFFALSENQLSLLKNTAKDIAAALNSIQSHLQIVNLLEQVQYQKSVLENQQDELRQTNEELSLQAERLQASEEELRVQEEELRHINTELEEKNEAVEVARQALALKAKELEITSKYKSEFLANMSHELRTPLNSVLILANLLKENKNNNLTDKQLEYAKVIHKSGSDLLNLINDILDLSKIEAGKIEFQYEQVPLQGIVEDIKQLFQVVAEEKSVQMITKVDENLPKSIFTDKQRLQQIIQNLLSNAFKFTPKGGQVHLTFELTNASQAHLESPLNKTQRQISISVSDTGIGIPADKQQLIFEAFQQADGATNRKYGGTGLGLSIIKELVKRMGGEIRLQSEISKGSKFSVFLPLDSFEPLVTSTVPVKPIEEKKIEELTLSKEIISQTTITDDRNNLKNGDQIMLIIEDDPVFANIVQDFARTKNYKTIVALQGDEGLMYAKKFNPSAIILDLHLPVVDGWNILHWLKNNEDLKNIPVHVISGAEDTRVSIGGALAYIQKPVKVQDLEKVFSLLGAQLELDLKNVLILSDEQRHQGDLLGKEIEARYSDLKSDFVKSNSEAIDKMNQLDYDCLIVDMRKNLQKGIENLKELQAVKHPKSLPVIVYIAEDLSPATDRQLHRLANVVIRESAQSMERLMDELELFIYKVKEVEAKKLPVSLTALNNTGLKGKKVLLVDDDMRNVFALSTLLEEQEANIITADNGREALEMLKQNPDTDLVLMDIMMPEMDGYEAIRRIRHDLKLGALPIIALTAKAMPDDKEKVMQAGASDYITKPIDTGQLFSLMRVWLSK